MKYMKQNVLSVALLSLLCGWVLSANGSQTSAIQDSISFPEETGLAKSVFSKVIGEADMPLGWIDFCLRNIKECNSTERQPKEIVLNHYTLKVIKNINGSVNNHVLQANDKEIWDESEYWDFPKDGKGDCEDIVLLKRDRLIRYGFPREALLITVAQLHNGKFHAVLTVVTNQGEYILDNLNDEVTTITDINYKLVKRQSQILERKWVSLE